MVVAAFLERHACAGGIHMAMGLSMVELPCRKLVARPCCGGLRDRQLLGPWASHVRSWMGEASRCSLSSLKLHPVETFHSTAPPGGGGRV